MARNRRKVRSAMKVNSMARAKTVQRLSRREGAELVDRQARKYLNMSGDEFVKAYREGSIEDPHRLAVSRLAILLPLVED